MTRPARIPTPRSAAQVHDNRLDDLERALRVRNKATLASANQFDEWVTFNITGAISGESDDYTPVTKGHLFLIFNTLKVAGGSDTIVGIWKNGVEAGTYTIPSGDKQFAATVSQDFGVGSDYLTLVIDTAGSGAQGLVAVVRFN